MLTTFLIAFCVLMVCLFLAFRIDPKAPTAGLAHQVLAIFAVITSSVIATVVMTVFWVHILAVVF